jgi:hypothetical protein
MLPSAAESKAFMTSTPEESGVSRSRFLRRGLMAAVLIATAALLGAGSPAAATEGGADVVLLDIGGKRAAVGTSYTFAYTVENHGGEAATEVELSASLGGSYSFVSATSDLGSCAYASGSETVTCDIGGLEAGASETVGIVVTPSGPVTSAASLASAAGEDPDPSNNGAQSAPQLLSAGSADLWVYPNSGFGDTGLGSAGYAISGEPYDYSIDVVNYGPAPAEDVILSLVLPGDVEFQSSAADCTAYEDEEAGPFVTCSLGRIDNGMTVKLTAIAPPDSAGQTLRTDVFVDGSGPDPGPSPNASSNQLSVVPGLSAADAKTSEHARVAAMPVELSEPLADPVTVDYATADGTAKAGVDYVAASGTLTFAPGEITQVVSVPVKNDRRTEPDKTFLLQLSNVGVTARAQDGEPQLPVVALGRATATGTILDDDPKLRIANVRVTEGDRGAKRAGFRITLSHSSPELVTALFTTANGSARAGSDYAALRTTVKFLPGQLTRTISVRIKADRTPEATERFFGLLNRVKGAVPADSRGAATIVDKD